MSSESPTIYTNPCATDHKLQDHVTTDHKTGNSGETGMKNCSYTFFLAASAVALGGAFQFGFSIGNMANTLAILQRSFGASDMMMSVVVASNPVGGLLGVISAGYLTDTLGRRITMILNCIPFLVGCALLSGAAHYAMLVLGRLLIGFGVGVGSLITNVFLSEISPVSVRGGTGALWGVLLAFGTFFAFILSIPKVMGEGDLGWRLFLAVPVIPATYQSVALLFCPDSPHYLAFKNKNMESAVNALARYRINVLKEEINALEQKAYNKGVTMLSLREILSISSLRLILAVGIGLMVSQQLSGVNGILAYIPGIFYQAGVSNTTLAMVITGLANIFGSILAASLSDKMGRRTLMWVGSLGVSVSCTLLAVSQSCASAAWTCQGDWTAKVGIVVVVTYFMFFALGAGTIPFAYIGEVFPVNSRVKCCGICSAASWICHIIVVLFFDSIDKAFAPYTFFLFATIMAASFIAIVLYMPETRQKTDDEIEKETKMQAKRRMSIVF